MRKHPFVTGEYYHIYNRGTDKRDIILDKSDLKRFFRSLVEFNNIEPVGSSYLKNLKKYKLKDLSSPTTQKLVSIISYCINPNHFHLILSPITEGGIEKYMQRIGGYTRYFNEKYKRSGVLFQGKFKSKIILEDRYLMQLSAYVNFNNLDKNLNLISDLSQSSLLEYTSDEKQEEICDKNIILNNFKNKKEYYKEAKSLWFDTLKRKEEIKIE